MTTCGAIAKWAIAPYGDPNVSAVSCDAHLVPFLESPHQKLRLVIDEFHVYPIVPEKRGTLCRYQIAEAALNP